MEQQPAGPHPILLYSWTMTHPYTINESLNVYEDGSVWYWSLMPAGNEQRNRVGTFQFQLPDREFKDLQALAEELAELPAQSIEPARNTIVAYVTGAWGGKSQPHLLSEGSTPTIHATAARADEIGRDLMRRAESAPLAVVEMSWCVVDGPVSVSTAASVTFNFKNPGLRPVLVQVKPEEYSLHKVRANGGSAQLWQGSAGFTIGITSAGQGEGPGALAGDGIYSPAQITPGKKSEAFFRDALVIEEAGTKRIGALVRGSLTLYYPPGTGNPMDEKYPNWNFLLETDPIEVRVTNG